MEILTWQARTKAELTLRQLEELTGISKTTLNNIENELWQLEKIAEATGSRITDLFKSALK